MKKQKQYRYSRIGVIQSIMRQARAAKLPEGWARSLANTVADTTDRWILNKDIITEDDLRGVIIARLGELSPDLAFAYQNHDKII